MFICSYVVLVSRIRDCVAIAYCILLGEDIQGQGRVQGQGQGLTQSHDLNEDHIHDLILVPVLDLHVNPLLEAQEDHGQPALNAPLPVARDDRVQDQGHNQGHNQGQAHAQNRDRGQDPEAALLRQRKATERTGDDTVIH